MLILGIDPGLQKTGWGLIEAVDNRLSYKASGLLRSAVNDPLPVRLASLHQQLANVITQHSPACAAVEETFVNQNPASALKLGQARGVVLAVPALYGLPVAEYSANKIKKSVVGSGHAGKNQVQMMVQTLLPGCGQISEDEADALAAAITHAHYKDQKQLAR